MAEEKPEEEAPAKKKKSKSPAIAILAAGVLILVGGAFFTPFGRKLVGLDAKIVQKSEKKDEKPTLAVQKSYFIPVPPLLVNLNVQTGKPRFLKLSLVLELTKQEDVPEAENLLPRIIDQFQIYLRGLRVDDLKGSEGIFRLKEQLLTRVNAETAPIKVHAILFKGILVQ